MSKTLKKIVSLALLGTLLLSGCQAAPVNPGTVTSGTETGTVSYSVTVVDAQGKPVTSGVVAAFFQKEEQAAIQPVDPSGKAEKKLPAGEYTVALQFTDSDSNYYYDKNGLVLTPEKNQLTIQLMAALNSEPTPVFDSNGESNAYMVMTGSTYVTLEEGRRNYFLFAPEIAGTYEITTSDPDATVGNYGYTAYIMANSISKVENNVLTLEVANGMVSSGGSVNPLVIGVDANGMDACVLTIERVGDPPYSIEDEPWVVYEPTVELQKFTTPEGTIMNFDLTAAGDAYTLVFNEADQTYHLNTAEGPQVLVQLGKSTQYLEALASICTTANLSRYFYDEDGNFLRRENYTKCMQIYSCTKIPIEGDRVQSAGKEIFLDMETGLYPLTKDLEYIIRNHGEYAGWWDVDSPGYLFLDINGNNAIPDLNPDIAWLFLCCYVEP